MSELDARGAYLSLGFDLGWLNLGVGSAITYPNAPKAMRWHCAGARLLRISNADAAAGRRNLEAAQIKCERAAMYVDAISDIFQMMKPACVAYEDYTVYDSSGVADLIDASKKLLALFGIGRTEKVYASVDEFRRAFLDDRTLRSLLERIDALAKGFAKATTSNAHLDAGRGDAANTLIVEGIVRSVAAVYRVPCYAYSPARVGARWRNNKRGELGKKATAVGVQAEVVNAQVEVERADPDGRSWSHLYDGVALAVMGSEERAHHVA